MSLFPSLAFVLYSLYLAVDLSVPTAESKVSVGQPVEAWL
jgi:hypothetical protein